MFGTINQMSARHAGRSYGNQRISLKLARDWNPEKHPRDSSGRWAAAQSYAADANARMDAAGAEAKRAAVRFVRRAKQEYDFLRSGKQERDDPSLDQRTADAKEAVTRAVSDALPGKFLDYFGGDIADSIAERLANNEAITEDDWSDGVESYRSDQAESAHAAAKQGVPAKYQRFIEQYDSRATDHLREHGRITARKVFKQPDIDGLTKQPMTDKALILRAKGLAPFSTIEAEKLTIGGSSVNIHRLRKEIIPLGESRRHPDKGYAIEVSRERADRWIKNFGLMRSRGHSVPAPPTHGDTKDNYGRWEDFSLDTNARGGQSLFGVLRIAGDDTLEKVLNKDVSIYTTAELPDDKGNVYDEAIEHVSVCTFPALTELSGWTPIAASRGQATEVPIFELSATPEPPMDLKKLRTALGAADTVSDADILEQAEKKITGIPGILETAKTDAIKPIAAERDNLKAQRDQLNTDLELARKSGGNPLNGELALERRLRVAEKIGKLRGTKEWEQRAINLLCGPKETPNTLMLSRASDAADDVRAMDFVQLMADYKPASEAGEKTGPQHLDLDRKVPPGNEEQKTDEQKAVKAATSKYLASKYPEPTKAA